MGRGGDWTQGPKRAIDRDKGRGEGKRKQQNKVEI